MKIIKKTVNYTDSSRFCLNLILLNFKQNRIQTVKATYRCCSVLELYNVYEIFNFIHSFTCAILCLSIQYGENKPEKLDFVYTLLN